MLVGALLDAARRESGLEDFGPETFREGLDVYVESLPEARLNDLGEMAVAANIVANLANRLRVIDWLARHPELRTAAVPRPIFVLGMPRTGTTLLNQMLAEDRQLRSLMRWEASSSVPPPEAATFDTDPRIEAARRAQAMADAVNPEFKAIHYDPPDGPVECVSVTAQDFKSLLWEILANVPTYGAWLRNADLTSAYEYHRDVLRLLQSKAPGRWQLKSPGHRLGIAELMAAYPDATIVVTHRDPVTVVASTCSLQNSLSGRFTDSDPRAYIASHWSDVLDDMVQRVDGWRDAHPADGHRFLDLHYRELLADPLATMRRVYDHVGAELTPQAHGAMTAHLAENPQGKFGRHSYDLADLGLDRATLEDRFAGYAKRYDIPSEQK